LADLVVAAEIHVRTWGKDSNLGMGLPDDDVGHHGITSAVSPATREAGEGTRNVVAATGQIHIQLIVQLELDTY
jgi:hypothetical protein